MTQDELLQLIDQAAAEGWTELDSETGNPNVWVAPTMGLVIAAPSYEH